MYPGDEYGMPNIIAIDAMGGDNAPKAIVQGAVLAATELKVQILLVGHQEAIEKELAEVKAPTDAISILHAPDIIDNNEAPTFAIRRKKESSLIKGLKAVKDGQASAFVSAGSTGALLAASTLIIGRAEGIERPALCVRLPNRKGFTFLVDCGANVDCKPSYLAQFAQMGSTYVTRTMGISKPRVGLVNIGVEQEKGNTLVKEAYSLLQDLSEQTKINFVGNVEAREIPLGAVDVAVCDAFVGNVLLKYTEGLAKGLMGMIKDELMSDPISKTGALLAKGAFNRIKKNFDHDAVGGAPFLGLKNPVIKAHGSSGPIAICNAVRQCVLFMAEQQD